MRQLDRCPSRSAHYWRACFSTDEWPYHPVFESLYDLFYEEELDALKAAARDPAHDEGIDQ